MEEGVPDEFCVHETFMENTCGVSGIFIRQDVEEA